MGPIESVRPTIWITHLFVLGGDPNNKNKRKNNNNKIKTIIIIIITTRIITTTIQKDKEFVLKLYLSNKSNKNKLKSIIKTTTIIQIKNNNT